MDANHFDDLLRSLSEMPTRRSLTRVLARMGVAGGLTSLLGPADGEAKKKRKKKKKCKGGKKKCGKKCIPKANCCTNANCGSGGTCTAGACICAVGFQICQGTCIPEDACCVDGINNGDETDVDCGGSKCPRCANGNFCESRDDCASAYCPPAIPRVCLACSTSNDCGTDGDGPCVCDTTVQGQKVCDSQLGVGNPVGDCAECPAGTNCVDVEIYLRCYKPCGAP